MAQTSFDAVLEDFERTTQQFTEFCQQLTDQTRYLPPWTPPQHQHVPVWTPPQHVPAWTPPPQQQVQQIQTTHETTMDHTPTGYAPYTRKRRNSTPSENTQVHKDTKIDSLPHWHTTVTTPPPPSQSPTPPQHPHALSPLLPTPSQPPSHQTIPPLMSIKFTPHTLRKLQSRLHQPHMPTYNCQPHTAFIPPNTPIHSPRTHPLPQPPHNPPIIPLTQTIEVLLHTVHQLTNTLQSYYGYIYTTHP